MVETADTAITRENYKCGLYLCSAEAAVQQGSYKDTEKHAKALARADKGALIAIWDGDNQPVKLFIGDTELQHKPQKHTGRKR